VTVLDYQDHKEIQAQQVLMAQTEQMVLME
jgi:hypothetical protein